MGRFFLHEIHFHGLPLVVVLEELRFLLAFCLEEGALPGGVTGILPTERAIQLGVLIVAFLTMLVFGLETIFPPWITVLV